MPHCFRFIVATLLGFIWCNPLQSQNLYDAENSAAFARYLKQSGQFVLATAELERLAFMHPDSDSLKIELAESYLLQNDFPLAIRRMNQIQATAPKPIQRIDHLLCWSLIRSGQFEQAAQFMSDASRIKPNVKAYYQGWSLLMQRKTAASIAAIYEMPVDSMFSPLRKSQEQASALRLKKPALAAVMSAIIPGSGKWYAGEKKDAVIGFVTIGVMAYQAWRGFNDKGTKSAYGWISAGLGAGFYLGNIYGAARSTKRYNDRKWKSIHTDVENRFGAHP
jgi:hypothetical protein